MELSNRKKIALIIVLLLIITIAALFIFEKENKKPFTQNIQNNVIQDLLLKADSFVGISPGLAKKNAFEALNISLAENQSNYIIQSWIILGKIKQIEGENDQAISFYLKAEQLAKQKSLYKELGEAKMKIGEIIYDHGSYDSALIYFKYAKKIADSFSIEPVQSYSLYYIGKYNETKGNFEVAKNYYNQALEISRKNKDYRQLAIILPSRGKNYLSEGKLNLALQCYMEAFQLSEQLNDKLLYAETSSHLGGLYLQMEQYDKALEYDKKALTWRNNLNNPEGIAKSFNNIGRAYTELKQPDSAFYYFNESLTFCEKINYKKGIVKSLTNIGKTYFLQGKYNKAIEYLIKAFTISIEAGYNIGIAESSLALANIYKNSHQTNKAIEYYQLSLSKVKTTNYDEIKEGIYQGLFDCYSSIADYKSALQNHILLLETEMKLLNVENKRQLALLNINFDSERKDKDNQVLRTDNEVKELLIKRKNILMWLIIVALAFTIVLCLSIYNRLYANKKANKLLGELNHKIINQNNELAKLNRELENANREKDKLFTIISHELRNPLYWFQNLAEVLSKKYKEMSEDKIQKSLSALDESAKNAFHLMDNLLQWSRSKLNRIHPKKSAHTLLNLISDTIEMYQTILTHKELEFQNGISSEIMVYADADLLCCVIRNLISNAIKYTPMHGNISINCSQENEFITIVVSDSGSGIPDFNINRIFNDYPISMPGLLQEKGSGLGLKLCKDFVELNGGKIWAKSDKDSGTQFFFTVTAYMPKELKPKNLKLYLTK
jgi:signal transduction histidine kinase